MVEEGIDDLSVPGDDIDLENIEMPEEGAGDDESSKRAAAFAKLRTTAAAFKKGYEEKTQELEKLKQETQAATSQAATRTTVSEETARLTQYRQNIQARVLQYIRDTGVEDPAEQQRIYYEMFPIIAAQDGMAIAAVQAREPLAKQILDSVVSDFEILNEEDKKDVRNLIGSLPTDVRTNPENVRKEIEAFIGQNMSRFLDRGSEETEETKDNPKPDKTMTPATLKKTKKGSVRLAEIGEGAGAAAASQLKSGSGVHLGGTANPKTKAQPPPKLEDEDIISMRKSGLDPEDPEDVKVHTDGKKIAKKQRFQAL